MSHHDKRTAGGDDLADAISRVVAEMNVCALQEGAVAGSAEALEARWEEHGLQGRLAALGDEFDRLVDAAKAAGWTREKFQAVCMDASLADLRSGKSAERAGNALYL